MLGQAELVVIDEAAAIPLPHVRALRGPYLVFMASTINGYESAAAAAAAAVPPAGPCARSRQPDPLCVRLSWRGGCCCGGGGRAGTRALAGLYR